MSVTLSQVTAGRRLKLNMSRTFTAAFALHGESLADAGYKGTTPDPLMVGTQFEAPAGAGFIVRVVATYRNDMSGWLVFRDAFNNVRYAYVEGVHPDYVDSVRGAMRLPGEPKPGEGDAKAQGGAKPLSQDAREQVGKLCPKCYRGALIEKEGRYGVFVGCNAYPKCDFIWKKGETQGTEAKAATESITETRHASQQSEPQDEDAKALAEILGRIASQKKAPLDEGAVRRIAAEEAAKVAAQGGRIAAIQINELPPIKLDGHTHSLLPEAVKWATAKRRNGLRFNIALVGDAGTGKSTLAEQVAKVLGLDYAYMNCSAGVTEAKLLGRMTPNITKGEDAYSVTKLVEMYEFGGVYCADEMDGLDANVLLALNGMIENGHWTRPDGVTVKRSTEFVFLGTMNTFGTGASRIFSGRNQLDGASLDRWKFLECDYDETLEENLCSVKGLAKKLHTARRKMRELNMRRWITGRAIERIEVAVQALGQSMEQAIYDEFASWTPNDRKAVGFPEVRPA